ncbi:MAG: aldo/keto reductase, partial [Treponemataceae bacterium]|nr:aldo/keto reductase [Treponemataceae bacterium]
MLYRKDRKGNDISQLGYGCMRFSKKGGSIDLDKTEKELMRAVEAGVNYIDTAYIYPGSEEAVGKIVAKNGIREKVNIATKLPQYLMRTPEAIEKTFNEELKRLQTTYIDYYLMHMFTDYHEWENLQKLGIEDWIARHKADGSIRNIGFSYHGDSDMFLKILNAYDWDFCQIQYNYLDEHSQAGRKGLEAAYEKGIPVVIMEPLRGGKLVNMLPKEALQCIKDSDRHYTAAEWSLRWLWNQPGVTCVLSGMNSMDQVEENLRIASDATACSMTDADLAVIDNIRSAIKAHEKVGCTGCRYCMPCPKGVDIPGIFYHYNISGVESKMSARSGYFMAAGLKVDPGFATKCIKCGKCEQHCPQHLPIREKLVEADKTLRPWYFKAAGA